MFFIDKNNMNDFQNRCVVAIFLRYYGDTIQFKNVYIEKKDRNENPDKRSRSLYAEAVSEVYSRNHYN